MDVDAAINRDEEHDDRLVPPDAELVPFEDVGVGSWFICWPNEHINEDDGTTTGKELKLDENTHRDGVQVATPTGVS